MSRKIRKNILVGYGNQGLYGSGGGVDIYSTTNNTGSGPTVLVNPGQYVIYDPTTNKTINTATWTKSTNGRWAIGVGVDEKGVGYSTALRKSFGEVVFGHNIKSVRVEQPSCGLVDVKDVFVKGCISSDESYSFNLGVSDGRTMGKFAFNSFPFETFTVTIPGNMCESCGDDINCSQIVDAVIKQMKPQTDASRLKNLKRGARNPLKKDFDIVPLYSSSYSFALNMSNSNSCSTCDQVEALKSISIDGNTVTFVNGFTGTATSLGQLESVVNQINTALNGKGSAVLVEKVGSCCNLALEINTCLPVGNITKGDNSTISPTTTNPFTAITTEADSVFCDASGTTFTPTCGFRIIAKAIKFEDACIFNPNPNPFPMRRIHVFGSTEAGNFPFYVKDKQNASWPRGLGVYWALEDYKSDNGGSGREHNGYNSKYGELGLPGDNDRVNAIAVNPKQSYVSVAIEQATPNVPAEHIGYMNILNGTTVLLIPNGDSTTKSALQTAINNYITSGENAKLPSVTI